MTPPTTPLTSTDAGSGDPQAGSLRLEVLKSRSDFLRAARAERILTPAFILQVRKREADEVIRVGFTCSKKVGNAVARNKAKRRLREIARLVLPMYGSPGTDYVFIGRANVTAAHPFSELVQDLKNALRTT